MSIFDSVEQKKIVRQPFGAKGLISCYNHLYRNRGFSYPRHLVPVARALCDLRIQKLLLVIGPGAGKSTILSQIYPAYTLGEQPDMTLVGVSGAENLMQGFVRAVMEMIEFSPEYSALFPNVRPDKNAGWSTDRGLYVTGHPVGDPDASFWGSGLMSSSLPGKHARMIICDDLHNAENSQTGAQCQKVVDRYYDTILGRADPRGCRYVIAGRRWHEKDIYGHLQETGDWVTLVLPAERPGSEELYYDVYVPNGLVCCFNENEVQ